MAQLGEEPTALGVARHYAGLASGFVLDAADRELSDAVARLRMSPHILDTVMTGAEGEEPAGEGGARPEQGLKNPRREMSFPGR